VTSDRQVDDGERIRAAGLIGAVLLAVVAPISIVLSFAALQFRADWLTAPALMVTGGQTTATLLRWGAFTDLFGYYVPMAPISLALWVALRPRDRLLADVALLGGLAFAGIGATGAAALSFAGPMLIEAHGVAGADREAIAVVFAVLVEVIFRAVWQTIDSIAIATFFLAVGTLLRPVQRGFGRLSLGLGVLAIVGLVLNNLGLLLILYGIAGLVFIGWEAWAIWLFVLLLHGRPPFDQGGESHR
jgi:hypothetical protein